MAQATHCEHLPWHGFYLYELTFPWDNPGQRLPLEMILMTTLSGGGREMQAMPCHAIDFRAREHNLKCFAYWYTDSHTDQEHARSANINFIESVDFIPECLAPYLNM